MNENGRITNRCPSCGHQTLFVGNGGYLTCSWLGCKAPSLVSDLLPRDPTHSPVSALLALERKMRLFIQIPSVKADAVLTKGVSEFVETLSRVLHGKKDG